MTLTFLARVGRGRNPARILRRALPILRQADARPAETARLTLRPSLIPALALLVLLGACASDDARSPRGPRPTLFLSPAGKPFHGAAGQPYPVGAWFAEADANHDGRLTREEFRADFAAFFQLLDVNHDGIIDGIELARYETDVAPEVLPRLAQVQGGFPGERPGGDQKRLAEAPRLRGGDFYDGAPEYSLLNVSEPVSSADLNFDGKISLAEFLTAADRRFDQLDKEHQGYLTLDALPQTPEQVGVEGKRRR